MTIQDTIKGTIRAASGIAGASDGARAEPTLTLRPARKIRRLPVQKDWPLWALIATQVGILVIIIALWQVAADRGWIDGFFWSKPSAIWQTLITFFTDGDAFTDIGFTFRSTIIGFLIGTSVGSMLGLSFWWSRNYAAIATALTLVVSTLTAYAGVKAVDPDQERLFYSLGASRLQVFRKLIVPFCLPWIISVLRVNIGLALTGAIVGEFIASQHGLGRQILYAGQTYDIALVWVAVLVLSTLAIVMYVTVSWIERVLRKGVRQ